MGNYRMCMCFIRTFKVLEAGPPKDVKDAFKSYADGGSHMTADQLRRFVIDFQGQSTFSAAEADRLVGQILSKTHHFAKFTRHTLTLDDFHHFLFSADLNPPVPLDEGLHDMTKPLSHYFIYTGHNSYLTGNQLSSDCSDVPIINALKRGVRVIELDLWPNSTKDDVHVLHGRTLTTPVELIRCLKSIKEHAFSFSPYPVIITLEDHLTPDLQAKVAWIITETFGDMLYVPEFEQLEELPSPEDLKHHIIISTKPPKKYNKSRNNNTKDSDDVSLEKGISDGDLLSDSEESEESENESNSKPDEYKRLIAIHAGKLKHKEVLRLETNVRRLSLSEKKFKEATEVHGMDLIRFTQKNILRVFPHATRLNSSNYKPMLAWMHGAQMVAFNMQGYGKSLWLMHGMFRANGGCGYVKKPDFLMKEEMLFNPSMTLPVKIILKVKVYMGDGLHLDFKPTHFDTYSPPDFYAKVGIAGVQDDVKMEKTRVVEDNWRPVWDEEFIFPLTVPELALLRIEVHDYNMTEKDDFGGQVCYPVFELRQGIRTLPLFDRKGNKLNSSRLLMRFHLLSG